MSHFSRGFTLIELLVAMAVGLVLVLVAMVAVRTTVQTAALAGRLSIENRLMRQGVYDALDELDYWVKYDDPSDVTRQGLRATAVMPSAPRQADIGDGFWGVRASPNDGLTNQPSTISKLRLGMSFTPFKNFPVPLANDFSAIIENGRVVGPRVRPVASSTTAFDAMMLCPVLSLVDDRDQASGHAYELDRDRGFDPLRPYQANDLRRWYRGNMYESPHSDKRFGRYGMLANLWQEPMLGYGSDPREIYSLGRTAAGSASNSALSSRPPGQQAVTGPYGPYPEGNYSPWGLRSRTWTWYGNQVVFLWESLGNFGMAEYLPSGTIIASYGTRAYHPVPSSGAEYPEPYLTGIGDPLGPTIRPTVRDSSRQDDNYMRMDERQDYRFSGYPAYWGYVALDGRSPVYYVRSGSHTPRPGTMWDATSSNTHPLLPITDWTGGAIVGMPMSGDEFMGIRFDTMSNPNPNTAQTTRGMAFFHRMSWAGPQLHAEHFRKMDNMSQHVEPLMMQKPVTWPDLGLVVQRLVFDGRITNVARVRWADPVTGEIAELGVTTLATTLRGARQQRRSGGGWARFYGLNDPRNDDTLDSP